ncbi:hypothetical protein L596_015734 [Steinernema carpocapsae]|uniref:G-protein coupled receptors family 1 profile domain-containing protein n=1 Tax=Steinernema carpocapsae TaxID=34508 RepID=A0A4U5NH43_STECR|nr:hypothetical protein L596_015734 [Steinernema carpocapsae]
MHEVALMVFYVSEGTFVLLTNIPLIIVIYFSRYLRKQRYLTLLGGLCIADTLNAVGYLFAGYYRISVSEFAGNASAVLPQSTCFFKPHVIGLYAGYQTTSIMTLLVTCERVFAVFYPAKHMELLNRQFVRMSIVAFVIVFILGSLGGASILEQTQHELIHIYCYVMASLGSTLWSFLLLFRIFNIGISVLLYLLIVWRVKQMSKTHHSAQRFSRVTITIGLSIVSALFCMLIPDLVMYLDPEHFGKYHMWSYLLGLNKSLLNTFVYMLRHEEIRKALCRIITNWSQCCTSTTSESSVNNNNKPQWL